MKNLSEAARALRDACDAVVIHYGEDAVCGQPPALEAVYQGRRAALVGLNATAMGLPAHELTAALSLAKDAVAKDSPASGVWWRWVHAAEAFVVHALRAAPASAPSGSQVARARASGYDGSCCPECGGFSVRRKGTCLSCDGCSWSGGCG